MDGSYHSEEGMTVGELLEVLQKLPQDTIVVQRDYRERYGYFYHTFEAAPILPEDEQGFVVMVTGEICTDVPPESQ